ncbi:hypothetical protein CLV78_103340 [Aliiruegeria haliotis]|uniref:Uncharacterized protein n=1 Tax=Aliiruegeria haliotis TaxID=1280846 RepID=A0A2T0RTG5_9RHOB|nr:hypothetical protein [Aliiruegeria haliotis]PRY24474.1 hypothetical protein CLV78_103340 [Aliiruegeria haliotis]
MERTWQRRAILAGIAASMAIAPPAGIAAEPSVLVYDVTSSGSPALPLLEIDAKARVRVREVPGQIPEVRGQLTEYSLAAILRVLVEDIGVLTIDDTRIEAEIRATDAARGSVPSIADGGVTRLVLDVPKGRNVIELHATALKAGIYPDIDDLQRLRQAETYLLELVGRLRAR